MWHKEYRDYPVDSPQIKRDVEPSRGIIGCEMHEINGWGNTFQMPFKKKKKGLLSSLLVHFLGSEEIREKK